MNSGEEYLDNLLKSMLEGSDANAMGSTTQEAPVEPIQNETDMTGISDELVMEESGIPDELALEETDMPDELTMEESGIPDELALEETDMPDELTMEESGIPDELALEETDMPDELTMEESGIPDELALEEIDMPDELALEETDMPDELALEETDIPDELVMEESGIPDELALEETDMPDELTMEESGIPDELALEETDMPDELALEETNTADTSMEDIDLSALLDEINPEQETSTIGNSSGDIMADASASSEVHEEENALEDFNLSDLGLDDLGIENPGQEETELAEPEHDDFMLDDALESLLSGNDEQGNNSLDDSLADGLALEDFPQDSGAESGEMPDVPEFAADALSSGGSDAADHLALEEYGESDQDLSALLEGMEHDEDLSEISELLEKSDQGVSVDDDMLAMLENAPAGGDGENSDEMFDFFGEEAVEGEPENIRELTQEESEEREESKKDRKAKKRKEKKAKKSRKKKGASEGQNAAEDGETDVLESLLEGTAAAEEKPKKQGFFARLLAFLFEEDEDEVLIDNAAVDDSDAQLSLGNLSEENQQLLEDLKKEDQEKAKKKGKKEKKKKQKKSKKGTEEIGEDEESEGTEKGKKKKFKRKKKEKQPKEEVLGVPEKKLPRKKVIAVFLYCATMAACIVVISMVIPNHMQKRDARVAYDHQKYTEVYDLLYGKKLSEEDELLLKKSSTILQMERKLNSYENYERMNMPLEALDALISGVDLYRNILPKADEYHVTNEVNDIYGQILEKLSAYGISEADALDIIASGDNVTYSQRLESIIYGDGVSTESVDEPTQDVLPEEEEIINRLEQLEESGNTDETEEQQE